ncbi:MAG: PspA/IM30 family protein [Planctomycetota bacterium]|jgi:phage shock protein A
MWARIKRIFRSIFGAAVESAEDPEKILKQNIRDMEDQVPKMNESIAMVKANVTIVEKQHQRLVNEERALTSKVKAALKAGRRDIAVTYATKLEQVKTDKVRTGQQYAGAKAAYDKALKVKQAFMRTKEQKVQEAQRALQTKQRSEWQKKVADVMENFQVAGIDATHDEMVAKLEQESAVDEARLEMALDTMETESFEIEKEAAKLEANETLRQLEIEMGLVPAEEPAPAAKEIGLSEG